MDTIYKFEQIDMNIKRMRNFRNTYGVLLGAKFYINKFI